MLYDLTQVFADLQKEISIPNIVIGLQQNHTLDFQEQVRKAVVAERYSGKAEDYKFHLMTLNSYHQ